MYNLIGTIAVGILFVICIVEYKKIKAQHEELLKVYKELDDSEQLNERLRMEIDYKELEVKTKILPILEKIQKAYRVSKTDKVYLLDYLSQLIYTFRHYEILDILYTINVGNKFTYKEATDNIKDFINHKHNKNIQQVVESIFYLIIK